MSAAASSSSDAPAAAPAPASVLFARGVIARLALWPALRIAVEQGWGGPESAEKRTWIASVIVDSFEEEDPKPDVPYVEEMLLQVLLLEVRLVASIVGTLERAIVGMGS